MRRKFFERLYTEGVPKGTVLVRSDADFWQNDQHKHLESAVRALQPHFNACLMSGGGKGKRGGDANAAALSFLWVDVDCDGGEHSAENLPTLEEAVEALADLSIVPNLLTFTGGGLHAYWILSAPLLLPDEAARDAAGQILRGWQTHLRKRFEQNGWHLDDTANLSRALRVPGALNRKYGSSLLPQVVFDDGGHCDIADFESFRILGQPRFSSRGQAPKGKANRVGAPRVPTLPPHLEFAIRSLCQHRGLRTTERRNDDGMLFIVLLDLCPACRGKERRGGVARETAHITPFRGRLKCKRESCSASGDGYALHEWVTWLDPEDQNRFQELEAANGDRIPEGSRVSGCRILPDDADEVELKDSDDGALYDLLDEAIRSTVSKSRWPRKRTKRVGDPGPRVFVAFTVLAPVGVGKTTALAKWLKRNPASRGPARTPSVAVFVRNHDVLEEVVAQLETDGVPVAIYAGPERACHFPDAVEKYKGWRYFRERICKGCSIKEDGNCAAWPYVPKDTVLVATHSAFWTLQSMWMRDPESGKPFKAPTGRVCVFDESPPSIDPLSLTERDILEPLTHLHDFVEREAVALVCRMLRHLFDLVREDRRRKHAGEHPTHYHGHRLQRLVDQAAVPLANADRLAAARYEARALQELFGDSELWEPLSDADADQLGARLNRRLRKARRRVERLESRCGNADSHDRSTYMALHQLGHAETDKADDDASSQALRAAKVDRQMLTNPDLIQVWGALLPLITPSEEEWVDSVCECGFLEVVADDRKVSVELNKLLPMPTGQITGMVILDATATLTQARLLATNPSVRLDTLALDVNPNSEHIRRRIWLRTSSTNRTNLIRNRGVSERTHAIVRGILRRVAQFAKETFGNRAASFGVITHKPLVDHWRNHQDSLACALPQGLQIELDHVTYFGLGERGTNALKACDGILVMGAPWPNIGKAGAEARALDLDPDTYIRHETQAALIQAVGRLRELRAERDLVLVVAGPVLPDGGEEWEVHYPDKGRPPHPMRDAIYELVWELLSAGLVTAPWLLGHMLEAAASAPQELKEALDGHCGALVADQLTDRFSLIGRFGAIPARDLQRWARDAKKPPSELQRVRTVPRGRSVWRPIEADPKRAEEQAFSFWNALVHPSREQTKSRG